jgi:hypothetical protein
VQAVYFHYPHYTEDALRINLPARYSVEAVPATAKFGLPQEEVYSLSVVGDTKGFTTRRVHAVDELFVLPKDYDGLRKYYTQFESKDQESVVLKVGPAATKASAAQAGN